ncbi:ImmA/IrrE family metallo-endopeptidase [Roseibium sp.]|uniref:ImmA/IrrE family metallo-endopeptidase n=1 Tax=Roseibium sp. TaxID=1936156 RepID=UPI003B50C380
MRRGFKSQAEKLALKHRANFGLGPHERLDPKAFLKSNGILVWEPSDVPGIDSAHLHQLTVVDPDSWSGVTIRIEEKTLIIVNSTHPDGRQANTLMHEWSHLELKHKPNRADRSDGGLLLLSDYPREMEEEADWLAGCMLLPRDGLLHHCGAGMDAQRVANHYGVSRQLASWRIGKTGVNRQLGARQY